MSSPYGSGLDRRALMQSSLAIAVLTTGRSARAENLGYVDSHSHLWSPDRVRYPLRPGANEADVAPKGFTPGEFFSHARPEGVNRVVLIGHTGHFGFDATYLTDLIKRGPARSRCRPSSTTPIPMSLRAWRSSSARA